MGSNDYKKLATHLTKKLGRPYYAQIDSRPGFSYIYQVSAFEGRVALSQLEVTHLMKTWLLNTFGILHLYCYSHESVTLYIPSNKAPNKGVWSRGSEFEVFFGAFVACS